MRGVWFTPYGFKSRFSHHEKAIRKDGFFEQRVKLHYAIRRNFAAAELQLHFQKKRLIISMLDTVFAHNDPDHYHDSELSLHDCVAEKITHRDGILRFYFADGFWVTPQHEANDSDKTVRTDASQVDFSIDDIRDIIIHVYTRRNISEKTVVEFWDADKLIDAVNSGKCSIEFIYQYRTFFEQMWRCALHFKEEPHYRECQLHIPGANATYRWNTLLTDREW